MSDENPPEGTAPSFAFTELERFGNYRIVGPLAKGGMAELSLAVQTGLEGFSRTVALKRVLPSQAASTAFVEMFLDEARLAARLDHPNIVRIYELGQEQARYFMAMEYLPGEDLQHVMTMAAAAGTHVDPDIAATIVERAAEGLHFAHQLTGTTGEPLGLVHRDVTPSNVILTYHGHVKVVDFGIARASTNTFETEPGMLKGKFGYLAPEQFTPHMQLDRRADIFGLGIILWEMLSGSRIFQRETQAATLAAAQTGDVPSLSAMRADVDEELEAIANQALARDPKDRFQTAAQMQDAIEGYLRGRSSRPSERDLARWLEGLGGETRAELKRSIARGSNVLICYSTLRKLAPTTGSGVVRTSDPIVEHAPRPLWQVGLFAAIGLLLVGGGAWLASRGPAVEPVVADTKGSAMLTSEPPGAFIFVGGEPTGRVTPSTLSGLDASKPLSLRLQKQGYRTVEANVALEAGKQVSRNFPLVGEQGMVTFAHAPGGGTVRVAGQIVRDDEPLELPLGKVHLEVVVGARTVVSRDVEIVAGPQTVDLAP